MSDYVKRIGSTAERLASVPYEKRVCRVEAHFPGALDPGQTHADLSVEDYVELISDVGFEVCIVSGEHNRGTPRFPSEMMTPHPNVENDLLPRFIEQAHAKGIIVLTYYPIIYCKPLKPKHPEWLMKMLDDGRPQEENLGWFCFNSPHRDWLADYLSDFVSHQDVDGFYFDDTNWGTHETYPFTPGCHCSYCEELFRADTGLAIPRKVDFDSMTFKRFVSWRYEKMIDFMHHLYGAMRQRYPDLILDMNTYFWPSGDWALGHPLGSFRLEEVGSYFFVETFRSAREPGLVSKILQSTGTPFGVFRNVTQSLKEFRRRSLYGTPYTGYLQHDLSGSRRGALRRAVRRTDDTPEGTPEDGILGAQEAGRLHGGRQLQTCGVALFHYQPGLPPLRARQEHLQDRRLGDRHARRLRRV